MGMASRKISVLTFVLFIFLVQWAGISKADSKNQNVLWKMGTNAPDAVGYSVYVKDHIIPGLKEITNDEVAFDWYWGGIMGDEDDFVIKMRIDQLQGALVETAKAVRDTGVLNLPFLFRNYDEVDYIKEKMRQKISNLFDRDGFKFFILIDADFSQFYSTKEAIRSPDDVAKTRFITWASDVEVETIRALGTNPIPVDAPEIAPSMRSGVCNTMLAPAIWYVGSQLYTITNYITPSMISYLPGCIIVTTKAWNRVPEKYRDAIDELMIALEPGFNKYSRNSNEKCVRAMVKYGVNEVKLTPDEVLLLKKRTRPVWDKLAGKEYSRELLDEILRHLEDFRSMNVAK
jgi:TRAP-type C4-dicarboxylate transport system substrate-binding protein